MLMKVLSRFTFIAKKAIENANIGFIAMPLIWKKHTVII